ncbi:MAG: hypothetical protein ACREE6_12810, partial [Limisphaerales bacterium]
AIERIRRVINMAHVIRRVISANHGNAHCRRFQPKIRADAFPAWRGFAAANFRPAQNGIARLNGCLLNCPAVSDL